MCPTSICDRTLLKGEFDKLYLCLWSIRARSWGQHLTFPPLPSSLPNVSLKISQAGVPLLIDIGVLDIQSCEPMSNVLVDIWSVNASEVSLLHDAFPLRRKLTATLSPLRQLEPTLASLRISIKCLMVVPVGHPVDHTKVLFLISDRMRGQDTGTSPRMRRCSCEALGRLMSMG